MRCGDNQVRTTMRSGLALAALTILTAAGFGEPAIAQSTATDIAPVDVTARRARPAARPRPAPVVRAAPAPRARVVRAPRRSAPVAAAAAVPAAVPSAGPGTGAAGLGNGETARGPVAGYVATRSASGTKTDTPIAETPQSVSVVPAQQVKDQGAQTLADTLSYVPGVTSQAVGAFGRVSDGFIVRGFNVETGNLGLLRDGLKLQSGVYDGTQEPYGLERIEVIKGATSVLYGQVSPGGLINAVSKMPLLTPYREVNLTLGSFARKEISADFSGPLTENGEWSYRLTGLYRNSDSYIQFTPDDKAYIAPAITWRPSSATSITLLGFYQDIRTKFPAPLPAVGTLLNNPPFGRFPVNRFYGEPAFDRFDSRSGAIGYVVDHAFTDALRLRHAVRYYQAGVDWDYLTVTGARADRRTLNRGVSSRNENSTGIATDTSLEGKIWTGPVFHTLLTGIDYYRSTLNSERFTTGTVGPLDVYAPVYGRTFPAINFGRNNGSRSQLDQVGVYVQDQMKLDRLVLLLGGRRDFATTRTLAYLTGARFETTDDAFTGRVGAVYLGDYGLAPFVSYSTGFLTNLATDRFGSPFRPTTSDQVEGGLRWEVPGMNTLISAAGFRVNQQNALVPDPVNITFSTQAGEVRSQGFEVESKTDFGPLQLVASYSYTDARTVRTTDPSNLGQRLNLVPYHLASAFGTYDLGAVTPELRGLRVGGGVRYIGSANIPGFAFDTKDATLLDLLAIYEFGAVNPDLKGWRAQVNLRNVTDRSYVTCVTSTGCRYSEPRNVFGTLSYRW
jgi:iron complex outermembrane recepter protein